jgi:hypothetical protein
MDSQTRYAVKHTWDTNPTTSRWNEVCIWVVEHFGLPGGRYITDLSGDYMVWYFENEQDQLLMTLAWGNDGF